MLTMTNENNPSVSLSFLSMEEMRIVNECQKKAGSEKPEDYRIMENILAEIEEQAHFRITNFKISSLNADDVEFLSDMIPKLDKETQMHLAGVKLCGKIIAEGIPVSRQFPDVEFDEGDIFPVNEDIPYGYTITFESIDELLDTIAKIHLAEWEKQIPVYKTQYGYEAVISEKTAKTEAESLPLLARDMSEQEICMDEINKCDIANIKEHGKKIGTLGDMQKIVSK